MPHNPDFNGAEQEGVGLYQVTHQQRRALQRRQGLPDADALARPTCTVITDARVTRILHRRPARQRRRVHPGRRQARDCAAAREVLLCAGALAVAAAADAVGHRPRRRICSATASRCVHDLPGVGRNLHDHVDVVQVFDAPQLKDLFGLSFTRRRATPCKGMLEWRRQRSGMLTTNFAEAGGFIKSSPGEPIPDLQLHFVIGKLVDHGRKTVFGHGYSCHVCLLRPKSRGSVSLASADPTGGAAHRPQLPGRARRPRAPGARLQADAHDPVAAGAGRPRRRASWQPRPARRPTQQIEAFVRAHADTIYHPVGSCRMGTGPARRGRCAAARARHAGAARGRRVDHAAHRRRQHQRADDHDRREGERPDPRRLNRGARRLPSRRSAAARPAPSRRWRCR